MYPYGAPSVKCAVCQYVTNVGVSMIGLIQLSISLSVDNILIYIKEFVEIQRFAFISQEAKRGPYYFIIFSIVVIISLRILLL